MANDITTLAIEIQSQEAERNLRTFNELLISSSQTASKMDKVRIDVDVEAALAQLQTLKAGYDDLAASAQNVHFDTGSAPGAGSAPAVDSEALNALKDFFASSAEMSRAFREEMEKFNEAIAKLEADTMKVASAGGKSTTSMRGAATVSREYAAALRELISAQKEMEKAIAKSDADMGRVVAADADADAVKKKLVAAQRELKQTTDALDATHRGYSGNIIELTEKEESLKAKVQELKEAYSQAKAEADKFGLKLDESAAKADTASQKYKEVKARVESMPKDPMGSASQSTDAFSEKAKLAGTQLTKLARGFNGVAMMAGAAIPGVSGLGRVISMLGMGNPYLAAAAIAIGAIVGACKIYDSAMTGSLEITEKVAASQAKVAESFKKEIDDRNNSLSRLAVLNSYDNLYDVEKEESRKIVEKLTAAYGDLGIQYDALTGKVSNLAEVTAKANEQDIAGMRQRAKSALALAQSETQKSFDEGKRNSDAWITDFLGIVYASKIPDANGYSGTFIDRLWDYVKAGKTLEEQLLRINQVEIDLNDNFTPYEQWKLNAKDTIEYLEKYRAALEKQRKAQAFVDGIGGSGGCSVEDVEKSIRVLEAKLETARNASLPESEKYSQNVTAIEALIGKQRELSALEQKAEVVYGGKKITADEALLEVETEITNRTRERLRYEKQLEALTAKIETQKRNWTMDDSGNITGRKGDAEKRVERNGQIDKLRQKIDDLQVYERLAYDNPARKHELKKEIAKKQLELNELQQERIAEQESAEAARIRNEDAKRGLVIDRNGKILREQTEEEIAKALQDEITAQRDKVSSLVKGSKERCDAETELTKLLRQEFNAQKRVDDAKKRADDAKKGFVWDKQENIVRRKNDAELAKERKREIAAAKAKVAATKAGSKERYDAEEELRRLQISDFAEREKNSAPAFMNQQKQVHSNMVQGIEARSSQVLVLETRNFSKPENALNPWKDVEKRETEIRDLVAQIVPCMNDMLEGNKMLSAAIENA